MPFSWQVDEQRVTGLCEGRTAEKGAPTKAAQHRGRAPSGSHDAKEARLKTR